MLHKCQIYVLLNKDQEIDYVGRSKNIKRRLQEHRTVLGYKPVFFIVDYCYENCKQVEDNWITFFREQGMQLRNIYSGQGPHFLSDEVRQRISLRHKGKIVSAATRQKMSDWQKGKPKNYSEEALSSLRVAGKKSKDRWDKLSAERKEELRLKSVNFWASRTPEQMLAWGQQSTRNNLQMWEQRKLPPPETGF